MHKRKEGKRLGLRAAMGGSDAGGGREGKTSCKRRVVIKNPRAKLDHTRTGGQLGVPDRPEQASKEKKKTLGKNGRGTNLGPIKVQRKKENYGVSA